MTRPSLSLHRPVAPLLPLSAWLPRIYLDMDGVLADFEAELLRQKMPAEKMKLLAGIYRGLPPYAGAIEGVKALEAMGFEIYIATKIPNKNPAAASEKLFWLGEHLPSLAERVIITPDKGCLGGEKDFIVDDRPHKANLAQFRGTVVHFGPGGSMENWTALVAFFAEVKAQALAHPLEHEPVGKEVSLAASDSEQ